MHVNKNHTYIIEAKSRRTGTIKYYTGKVLQSSVDRLGEVGAHMRRLMQHRRGKGARCLKGHDLLRMVTSDYYPESDFKTIRRNGKTIHSAKFDRSNKSLFVDHAFEFDSLNDNQYLSTCSGQHLPYLVPRFVPFWKKCEPCKGFGFGRKGIVCPENHPEYGLPPYEPGDYWCVECNEKGGIGVGKTRDPIREWYRQEVLAAVARNKVMMSKRENRRWSKPS